MEGPTLIGDVRVGTISRRTFVMSYHRNAWPAHRLRSREGADGGLPGMFHRLLVLALALFALVAPATVSAQSTIDLVVSDIDAFWAQQFANAGLAYASPTLRSIDGPMDTSCGYIDPYFSPGAYCAADQTVYYSTALAPNDVAGEV